MFGRTSFAIVAALGALLVAAPASADNWAQIGTTTVE